MFKKKKDKKKENQLTEDEYKRLVELEKQHGPQHSVHGGAHSVGPSSSSTPRTKVSSRLNFPKRKESKRVNKLDISTPFAFQHVAQACPDDRISIHSSRKKIKFSVLLLMQK
jgi:hypothetical protein